MSPTYVVHGELPALDRPVLVVVLSGWIDAGGAASAAIDAIHQECSSTPLVTFDGDTYIDYRARRPIMELREGVSTRLVWSDTQLWHGTSPDGYPVLTLTGPEPDAQWRGFAHAVTELALRLGVYQMVALGAYPVATPHTRPPQLTCTSPSADVVANVPFLKRSADVPAGMSVVLEHALTEAGIPSLGIWVQVPHYAGAMPFPAAASALLGALREVTGIHVGGASLAAEAATQLARIDQLIAANPEHVAMVRQLEEAYDAAAEQHLTERAADLPTGDDLAAEFERFLRDQGE